MIIFNHHNYLMTFRIDYFKFHGLPFKSGKITIRIHTTFLKNFHTSKHRHNDVSCRSKLEDKLTKLLAPSGDQKFEELEWQSGYRLHVAICWSFKGMTFPPHCNRFQMVLEMQKTLNTRGKRSALVRGWLWSKKNGPHQHLLEVNW